jgi:hypothetical protein
LEHTNLSALDLLIPFGPVAAMKLSRVSIL